MPTTDGQLRWWGKVLDTDLKQVRLIFISDIHYGNSLCSIKHLRRTIDFIKNNEDVYCFLNGDLCESTLKTSKGDIYKQVGTPQDQRDWVIETFLPIKDRILGMTTGNHEDRIYREAGIDISQDIADDLSVPYRMEGMLYKIAFGDGNRWTKNKPYVFWIYFTHGYGGARTRGAKNVKVQRLSEWIGADCFAMSHDHEVDIAPHRFLFPDQRGTEINGFLNGKITAYRQMLIKTNAYIKWGGYAEMKGYAPSDLATPVVCFLSPKSEYWKFFPDKPIKEVKIMV